MFQIRQTLAAAAAFAVMGAAALPVLAADQTAPAAPAAPSASARHHHQGGETVDAKIADLHGKLQITEAQATPWAAVAQVMRDNDKSYGQLVAEKRQNETTMTAIEDLRAYQQIAEAHADGVKKLVAAFEPLYESMSAEQKAIADTVFRDHKKRHAAPKAR